MNDSGSWQVPGSWSEIYQSIFVPAMMGEWPLQVIALTFPQPGEHVLDIACGTGALTRCVAKSLGPSGRVVGLDLSPEMLAVARTIAPHGRQSASIEWQEGDANALPFESETFDVAYCAFGLMFFLDRVAALKEMWRVLKQGGRLALSVWGPIGGCPGQKAIHESWERHFGADEAAGFLQQHVLGDHVMVYSIVREAGFREISVQLRTGMVRWQSPEQLVRSCGALSGTSADEATRNALIDEVSTALQPYVTADGLAYPIEAILASARK